MTHDPDEGHLIPDGIPLDEIALTSAVLAGEDEALGKVLARFMATSFVLDVGHDFEPDTGVFTVHMGEQAALQTLGAHGALAAVLRDWPGDPLGLEQVEHASPADVDDHVRALMHKAVELVEWADLPPHHTHDEGNGT